METTTNIWKVGFLGLLVIAASGLVLGHLDDRDFGKTGRFARSDLPLGQNEQLMEALESGNWEKFSELRDELGTHGRLLSQITEESFPLLVQMHSARESGDIETLKDVRGQLVEQLGIADIGSGMKYGRGMRERMGLGLGMREKMRFSNRFGDIGFEQREQIREAISSGDWRTFSDLRTELGIENGRLSRITEESFPTLVKMHKLREELRSYREQLREQLNEGG